MWFFAILLASGIGFGLALLIFGSLLDKSNNFGDNYADMSHYGARLNLIFKQNRLKGDREKTVNSYSRDLNRGTTPPGKSKPVHKLTPKELDRIYNKQ